MVRRSRILPTLLLFCLLLPACGSPQEATRSPVLELPTGSGAADPAATQSPDSQPPAGGGTVTPSLVIHESMPGDPVYFGEQMIFECTMGYGYSPSQPLQLNRSCDAWSINYLERPLSPDLRTYYPFLDIELAQIGYAGGWFFARMRIFEAAVPLDGEPFTYAFELDGGFDGRGDVLITVTDLPLNAVEWSVMGVRAWADTNGDVGGSIPIRSDSGRGDGYETLLSDQGLGADPDLVWARRSPSNQKSIEFAFKPVLLGGRNAFLWWGWAYLGEISAQDFDMVDGSVEIFQIDNTCSMDFNGQPMGFPNSCRAIQPTPTAAPTCIQPPQPALDYYWDPVQCKWFQFN